MNRLPQKASLVSQTVSVIIEEIESGRWTGRLPGEHDLCEQLHVSRRTIRAALAELKRSGVVQCRHGKRREIISRLRVKKLSSNRVIFLLPARLELMNPFLVFLVDRLREHLMEHGYVLETHAGRMPYRGRVSRELESLAGTLNPAGWVLGDSTEEMQAWFAAREVPCVVVGSLYREGSLPSVDRDYQTIGTHAVNQFVARGHKNIVLLNPNPSAAGDNKTATGFHEAAAKLKRADIHATVVQHDTNIGSICARVDGLLARDNAPTAYLVSRARHVLTVLGRLLSNGVRIPKDVALISRDDDFYLEDCVPAVARYSSDPAGFASRVSRVVLESLRGETRRKEHKLMPKFIRGETLG